MPSTVSQVATGLATRLDTIPNLRVFSYEPDQLNPPVAFPVLNTVVYHRAFQGGDVVTNWTIRLVVGRWVDRNAYQALDDYLSWSGAQSVRAAIEADKTLGGICNSLIVSSSADISSLAQADAEFLEIRFQVEVHG